MINGKLDPVLRLGSSALGEALAIGEAEGADVRFAVERAFGIVLANEERSRVASVGDLFALVRAKTPPETRLAKCAAVMAFARLRLAIVRYNPHDRLVPSAKLADIVSQPPYRFHAELERSSGLNVPGFHFSKLGNAGLGIALLGGVGIFASLLVGYFGWWVALFVAGVVMMVADPRRLPDLTLGEFAQELAMLNLGSLTRAGARTTDESLWNAYVQVLQAAAGVEGRIGPETPLKI